MRYVKYVSCFFVLIAACSGMLFAQETNGWPDISQNIAHILTAIIDFASWIWVLLAIIAGKVMTNDLVYGEFLKLDTILWQMRVVARQIATFAIGFLFLYQVLVFIFNPSESSPSFIKQKLWYLILGWVLIQMSWFLLWALLDLSTIATAGIGSMPSSVFNQMPWLQQVAVTTSANLSERYVFNTEATDNFSRIQPQGEKWVNDAESIMDILTPSTDSLSWPLIFLGASLFSFQDFTSLQDFQPKSVAPKDLPSYLATVLIKFGVILMYSVALLLLVLINVFRVVTLWIVIPFSPLLIIAWVFKQSWVNNDVGSQWWLGTFTDVLKIIFAPTVFTAALGFSLIVILSFMKIINPDTSSVIELNDNISIIKDGSTQTLETNLSSTSFDGDIFASVSNTTNNLLTDLLVVVLSLALIWFLVQLSIGFLPDKMIGKEAVKSVQEWVWDVAGWLPVIPLPGGGAMGIKTAKTAAEQLYRKTSNKLREPTRLKNAEFRDDLFDKLGLLNGLSEVQKTHLNKHATTKWMDSFNAYRDTIKKKQLGKQRTLWSHVYALDSFFKTHIKTIADQALSTSSLSVRNKIVKDVQNGTIQSLSWFFSHEDIEQKEKKNLLAWLHEQLWGEWTVPTTYKKFTEKNYGISQ